MLPRGVRRALDAMHANIGHDWSAVDLAALSGASSRTLQRQFRVFLKKTPRDVLRDLRFEHARRELLNSLPDMKVMEIALRCGFTHCGRFSVEYGRRYGETPSQTLKRQALFIGALARKPSFFSSGRDRPTVALGPIDASPENREIAGNLANELVKALTRAGVSVTTQPGSGRYHLAGSILGSGRQRLTLRLTEAETGKPLSAHRSDGALGDFTHDEHLATRIAATLQPCIRLAEIDRAGRKPDIDLTTHDLTLRAMPGVMSLDADGNSRALDLLTRAADRDSENPLTLALAAWTHAQRIVYHFTDTPEEERARSMELVNKAQKSANDAMICAILGNALALTRNVDAADAMVRKALSVDGGSAWAWGRSAWIDLYKHDVESSIERFKIALALAPDDPIAFNNFLGLGCANFMAGRYQESIYWQERVLTEHPSAIWVHRTLCPAYALSGAHAEARHSLSALRTRYPGMTIRDVQQHLPPFPQSYSELMFEALQTAGLPS